KEKVGWRKCIEMVMDRFLALGDENLIGEFNKLRHDRKVDEYQRQIRGVVIIFMISMNQSLNKEYFVKSFLSRTKEEIKHMMQILQPESLSQAIYVAKMLENLLEVTSKAERPYENEIRRELPRHLKKVFIIY
ncbi:hypothetical protein Salat_1164100, partial [Sesamum alatum]